MLICMPFDILDEILLYLNPLDLLYLARTAICFRIMIMSKGTKHIWRQTEANAEMPECPVDMSHPSYVSLFCERLCSGCGFLGAELLPELHARLCRPCFITKLGTSNQRMSDIIKSLIPYATSSKFNIGSHFLISDYASVSAKYNALEGEGSSVDHYVRERKAICIDRKKFGKCLRDWNLNMQRKEFQRVRQKLLEAGHRESTLPNPYSWIASESTKWERTIVEGMDQIAAGASKDIWDLSVRPELERLIKANEIAQQIRVEEALRRARETEFKTCVLEFFQDFPTDRKILPTLKDMLLMPTMENLITGKDNCRTPITTETFTACLEALDLDIEAFQLEIQDKLAELFNKEEGTALDTPIHEKLLARACTLFCCSFCHNMYGFTRLFAHPCCRMLGVRDMTTSEIIQQIVSVPPRASAMCIMALQVLGLPPDSTHQEVSHLQLEGDKRLVCTCGHPKFRNPATLNKLIAHLVEEDTWYRKKRSDRLTGRTLRSQKVNSDSEVQLINDHDESALPYKIVLLQPGQVVSDVIPDVNTSEVVAKVPSAKKWNTCELCRQLTGTSEYLRGDKKLAAYHMRAKHGVGS